MIEVREATADDRGAILRLRARCFAGEDAEKREPRFWDWEFRGGRMFVAEEEGNVVAHLGLVAQPHVVGGMRVPAFLAVDAMTDPAYRGRQLFAQVATYARDALSNVAAFSGAWQIRGAVLRGITAGGWSRADAARVLIRPILPLRLRAGRMEPMRDVQAMSSIAGAFFGDTAHVDRTPEWLQWRYFDNPLWRYEVTGTNDAYLVTRRTKLKGIETLAIVDVAWRREGDARALLAHALRGARTPIAATLVTRAHPAYGWFLRRGFLPGPHRFHYLVNAFTLEGSPRWALAWGDTDHL
ncbi:MAG TPA: GNAT family N-acetyltransferase [Thermoanaerobaculia bacterium]|nr:GNAT family N-acetyltransferase [Thermoanaerobaculia bacterium]